MGDARAVADAVLYEGYVLYPYRASATKNQMRWQFGVLVPPAWLGTDPSERSSMRTECVVDPGTTPVLTVRARFLQVQERLVERADGRELGGGLGFVETDALSVDGARIVAWDEAVEHDVELDAFLLLPLATARREMPFHIPAGEDVELVHGSYGGVAGRVVRRRAALDGLVRASAEWAEGPGALMKVTVTVENTTTWSRKGATADEARVARRRDAPLPGRGAHDAHARRRRLRVAPRPARRCPRGRRRLRQRRDLPRARRRGGGDRSRAVVADHPVRPPGGRAREPRATSTTQPRSTRSSPSGCSP